MTNKSGNTLTNRRKLPEGRTTFSAGTFGVRGDGFLSSGGETSQARGQKIKRPHINKDRFKMKREKCTGQTNTEAATRDEIFKNHRNTGQSFRFNSVKIYLQGALLWLQQQELTVSMFSSPLEETLQNIRFQDYDQENNTVRYRSCTETIPD